MKNIKVFWEHRSLLFTLVKHQLSLRYAGTLLGLLWSVLTPLLMLSVYCLIFSLVFHARWEGMSGTIGFAIMVFCGLIPFYVVVDILSYSPRLFRSQSQLIKKMIFPLELLPSVPVITALFHMTISMGLLILFYLFSGRTPGMTILLVPLVLIPTALWGMGLSILLSLVGVFIRDIVHLAQFITGLFLFLSPVFYSEAQVPQTLRWVLEVNPMTHLIHWIRCALRSDGDLPVLGFILLTVTGWIVFVISFQFLIRYKSEVVDGI